MSDLKRSETVQTLSWREWHDLGCSSFPVRGSDMSPGGRQRASENWYHTLSDWHFKEEKKEEGRQKLRMAAVVGRKVQLGNCSPLGTWLEHR